MQRAFTLVEISIVLVVLGLLAGGVLVGQDLIKAAEAKNVMSQMESYSTAVNTFKLRFLALPGDITNASQFGLGNNGDGNGYVDGNSSTGSCAANFTDGCITFKTGTRAESLMYRGWGETNQFWVHLGKADLIPEQISTIPGDMTISRPQMDQYFPRLRSGKGNLQLFVWNYKTYIRTGVTDTDGYAQPRFTTAILTGMQTFGIMTKRSGSTIYDVGHPLFGAGGTYPLAMKNNQRVIPLSTYAVLGDGNDMFLWTPPDLYDNGGAGKCVDGTATPPRFNQSGAYVCNILWQMDM